jgi:hypothetical protein
MASTFIALYYHVLWDDRTIRHYQFKEKEHPEASIPMSFCSINARWHGKDLWVPCLRVSKVDTATGTSYTTSAIMQLTLAAGILVGIVCVRPKFLLRNQYHCNPETNAVCLRSYSIKKFMPSYVLNFKRCFPSTTSFLNLLILKSLC